MAADPGKACPATESGGADGPQIARQRDRVMVAFQAVCIALVVVPRQRFRLGGAAGESPVERIGKVRGVDTCRVHALATPCVPMQTGIAHQRPAGSTRDTHVIGFQPRTEHPPRGVAAATRAARPRWWVKRLLNRSSRDRRSQAKESRLTDGNTFYLTGSAGIVPARCLP
jgi:hypothetical protein